MGKGSRSTLGELCWQRQRHSARWLGLTVLFSVFVGFVQEAPAQEIPTKGVQSQAPTEIAPAQERWKRNRSLALEPGEYSFPQRLAHKALALAKDLPEDEGILIESYAASRMDGIEQSAKRRALLRAVQVRNAFSQSGVPQVRTFIRLFVTRPYDRIPERIELFPRSLRDIAKLRAGFISRTPSTQEVLESSKEAKEEAAQEAAQEGSEDVPETRVIPVVQQTLPQGEATQEAEATPKEATP